MQALLFPRGDCCFPSPRSSLSLASFLAEKSSQPRIPRRFWDCVIQVVPGSSGGLRKPELPIRQKSCSNVGTACLRCKANPPVTGGCSVDRPALSQGPQQSFHLIQVQAGASLGLRPSVDQSSPWSEGRAVGRVGKCPGPENGS